ncbi:hypothetical protein [Labedaea rhizosphaerae]|uniref:Uncharacterized protein n=1 Tax=Labedaea rhizosphaerae TaxID=598644 RepID=A0A4R6S539_LABRH|nr:hypothetical protein [Labedaea rhizosphaerae]TDP94899.1 hypothetical protein EV186_105131 [Labedaea rhizosphaerae]
MTAEELLDTLPIRDVRAKGTTAQVDFARGTAGTVDVVAGVPDLTDDRLAGLASSIRSALHHYFSVEDRVEVVVRRLDGDQTGAEEAGQQVVENLHRLTTALRYVPPVPAAADLVGALPLRGIKVRAGSAGNCAGIVVALVDLEPDPNEGFSLSLDEAQLPPSAEDFREIIEEWAEDFASGIRAAIGAVHDEPPPIRVVVHKLAGNYADANRAPWQKAGRLVVEEAVRRATG